jgi:diguanylate cyclase (GGDEF)-like protein
MESGMLGNGIWHLFVISLQACFMAALLTALFRLRGRFGLGFFIAAIVALGAFDGGLRLDQIHEHGSWLTHFGGSMLFSAKLFAVLLLYVREDAIEARALLYGLLVAALALVVLNLINMLHFVGSDRPIPGVWLPLRDSATHAFGMAILIFDAVVLILIYEWSSQRFVKFAPGHFLPALVALTVALSLDNLIYYTLFVGTHEFGMVLLLSFLGKWYAALLYAFIFALALRWVGLDAETQGLRRIGDVYESLSFRQRFEALRRTAEIDALTGLYTRSKLESDASRLLEQSGNSLWVLDVDHFKRVNDLHGHLKGDAVLREIAARIRRELPENCSAYRYGGEEFVVLGPLQLEHAEALRSEIAATPIEGLAITLSIGAARSEEANKLRAAFAIADARLYQAKQNGRNRVVWA